MGATEGVPVASVSAGWKLRLAWGFATAGLLALSLLVVPAAAEAGKGTAEYEYKVSQFDYNATGDLTAARSQECVAGRSASWVGHVATGPSDLGPLGKLGEGSLEILKRGTDGKLKARTEVESNFGPAEHTLVTACDTDPASPHYGQQTETSTTECTDGPAESKVEGSGSIQGGVGNQVKIDWRFRQVGVAGHWVPDIFRCVEPFEFVFGACQSQAKLNSFTDKKFKLPFRCFAQDFTPPPGDYYQYGASSTASGSLELKRTKQS